MLGERPVIFGDGLQSRDFTFVSNNVSANLLACTAPGAGGGVFNIACSERATLIDLVAALNELLGTNIEPVIEPERPGDVKHSFADISKAHEVMGYSPSISFKEGLEELVRWTTAQSST